MRLGASVKFVGGVILSSTNLGSYKAQIYKTLFDTTLVGLLYLIYPWPVAFRWYLLLFHCTSVHSVVRTRRWPW